MVTAGAVRIRGTFSRVGKKELCSFSSGTGCVYFLCCLEISELFLYFSYIYIYIYIIFFYVFFLYFLYIFNIDYYFEQKQQLSCVWASCLSVRWVRGDVKIARWWWPPLVVDRMAGGPPRVPTAGDPAGYGERWGWVLWRRVRWRVIVVWW